MISINNSLPGDYPAGVLLALLGVALVAGWVDTLAGGGGLLTVPALLLAGMPPVAALATNKLQGTLGTATATLTLVYRRQMQLSEVWPLMTMAALGSVLGTLCVQWVNTELLQWVIPVVLFLVAMFFLLSPAADDTAFRSTRISPHCYRTTAVPLVGAYDGLLGPGTGSFFAMIGAGLQGQSLLHATIRAKAMNFATNLASVMVFASGGKVVWSVGMAMMAGQIIGAFIGSHTMLKRGGSFLRPMVIIMCLSLCFTQVLKLM